MKRRTEQTLKQALHEAAGIPSLPPATDFWERFRARAALINQESAPAASSVPWWWRHPVAMFAPSLALMLALATIGVLHWRTPTHDIVLSKVDEVDVFVDYNTVMIVEDAENHGTMIWLDTTPRDGDNQGG